MKLPFQDRGNRPRRKQRVPRRKAATTTLSAAPKRGLWARLFGRSGNARRRQRGPESLGKASSEAAQAALDAMVGASRALGPEARPPRTRRVATKPRTGIFGGGGNRRRGGRRSAATAATGEVMGPPASLGQLALGWVLPVVVACAAFALPAVGSRAYDYVMETGHFHVEEVWVEGTVRVPAARVKELAGIHAGTHVLAADLDRMEAALEAHPWLATAAVRRELPDRLVVSVVEHEPRAIVVTDGRWLVNGSGEPFVRLDDPNAPPADDQLVAGLDLPLITGVSAEDLRDKARAADARADIRAAVNLARLYESQGLTNRWPLAEVRLEAGRARTLVLSGVGTEARVGRGPYRETLFRLEWVLEWLHDKGQRAEYVLLDGRARGLDGEDGGRVVVKPLGEEEPRLVTVGARASGGTPPILPTPRDLWASRPGDGARLGPTGVVTDPARGRLGPPPVAAGVRPAQGLPGLGSPEQGLEDARQEHGSAAGRSIGE